MMQESENVKFCPVCHYTESSQRAEIAIKVKEEEVKVELPKVELYRVSASGVNKVASLDSNSSHIVVDRNSNTIWVWKGAKSSSGDVYKAGIESTKLKSSLKLYSANIVRVEEGDEPEKFPKIGPELEAKLEEEEARKREEEEVYRRKEREKARRLEEEEARKREEEEEARRIEEEEARKREEEEEARRLEEEEARKHEEEEEARRLEEEEARKRKEEEEAQRLEEEAHKREEEQETKRREEEESKKYETKLIPEEEISNELKEAITSLTLIRGINKEIAIKLFEVGISTIMELSLSDSDSLAIKSGIEMDIVENIIKNAKELLGIN